MANFLSSISNLVVKRLGGFTPTEVEKALTTKESNTTPRGLLSSVDPTTAKTKGAPTETDFKTLYRIYKQESWVRASIDVIRRAALANSWEVRPNTRKKPEQADEQNKEFLLDFLERPNPEDSFDVILGDLVGDLQTYGNAYIEIVKNYKGEVAELYNLDATTMKVKHDEHGVILGYTQESEAGSTVDFEPNEVIHFKLTSKGSSVYGLSPLESLIRPVDTDLKAQIYIAKYYENFGAPKALFKFKNATPEQVRRNRLYLATQVAGVENAHKNLVLEGDVEYTPLGTAMKDTETLKIREYLRGEILAVYGVPPHKVSIIKTGQLGGNVDQWQDRTFKQETIIPLQRKIMDKLNHKLVKGIFGIMDWEIDFGDVLEQDRKTAAKIHEIYLEQGVLLIDEVREELGLSPLADGIDFEDEGLLENEDNVEDEVEETEDNIEETEEEVEEEIEEQEEAHTEVKTNFKANRTVNATIPTNEPLYKQKNLDVDFNIFEEGREKAQKVITKAIRGKIQTIADNIRNL